MEMIKQKKKTTGRRKIEIKKLEKDSSKQVTFSKRRAGLFKKASELCILCNAQAAIIVFSPADKLFCFAQPNIETVIARYQKGTIELEPSDSRGQSVSSYKEHNRQYEEATKMLQLEKKKLADIEMMNKNCRRGDWWNESIDNMSGDQLEQFTLSIFELRKKLAERACQIFFNL